MPNGAKPRPAVIDPASGPASARALEQLRIQGHAVRAFVAEQEATGVIFAGDDLGDVVAFEAVRALRADGLPGLVVCSASHEQPDLVDLADVVVDGPAGMVDLLGHRLHER